MLGRERLLEMRGLVRQVPVARPIQDFVVRLVEATDPARSPLGEVTRFVRYGSSPRGAQALILGAKIEALRAGRFAPSFADVRRVAIPALRHRVLLNFDGEAEGITPDALLEKLLATAAGDAVTAVTENAAGAGGAARADGPIGGRFDDRFLRKLESLALTIRRTTAGRSHGMRRSRRVGAGLEFADHRDYVPGDDLRYLDWNLYGRLERRALRLYEEDEDLSIDVLVDASASMAMGRPPKLDLAFQIGAALAYVGLSNLDRVAVTALGAEAAGPPPARGKARILPILRYLDVVRPPQRTSRPSLAAAVREFLSRRRGRRRGLVALVSDFYDPAGARAALELVRRQPPRSDRRSDLRARRAAPAAARRPAALRRRDGRGARADHLAAGAGRLRATARGAAARARRLLPRARHPLLHASSSDQPFDAVVLRMFRAGGLLG